MSMGSHLKTELEPVPKVSCTRDMCLHVSRYKCIINAHETAIFPSLLINNFTGTRKKFDRFLINQHLSTPRFCENIRRGKFLWIQEFDKRCVYNPTTLVMQESKSDELYGL